LGTDKDNVNDMIDKNRQYDSIGERNGNSKLSWEDVKEIRKLYSIENYTLTKLGIKFSISPQNIFNIVNNKLWRIV
jgi:hypothetical protein